MIDISMNQNCLKSLAQKRKRHHEIRASKGYHHGRSKACMSQLVKTKLSDSLLPSPPFNAIPMGKAGEHKISRTQC